MNCKVCGRHVTEQDATISEIHWDICEDCQLEMDETAIVTEDYKWRKQNGLLFQRPSDDEVDSL